MASAPRTVSASRNGAARGAHAASGLVTALIYTRVSSEDQRREGMSLDVQLAECRRYAAGQGWLLGPEYQDVLTGKRDDRPQYQALLADVRAQRAEGMPLVVVVAALDRFGRRLLERVRSREELKALGVATHSVREGGEVSDLVANVLAAVAQEEVRRLGERVSASRQYVRERGWHPVCRPPWGYRWRPATAEERAAGAPKQTLEIDPDTAPFAREMFRRLAEGASVRSVCRWAAELPEAARGGRSMPDRAVRRAMAAPVYAGLVSDDGPDGRWPALITPEEHRAVADRLSAAVGRQPSQRFLLTGLMRCPKCGHRMQGFMKYARGPYYRCGSQHAGAGAETHCTAQVHTRHVDPPVLAALGALLDALCSTDPTIRSRVRRHWAMLQRDAGQEAHDQEARQWERAAKQARDRLTRAAELFVDGAIDRAGYELLRDKAREELERAEAHLADARPQPTTALLPPLDEVLTLAGDWRRILDAADRADLQPVVRLLVAGVRPERQGFAAYETHIDWTPLGQALRQMAGLG